MYQCPTWLEMIRVAAEALVPLSIAIVGWILHGHLKAMEERAASLSEVRKQRALCYSELAPLINHLLCYGTYTGHWQTLTPPEILDIKRAIDSRFFSCLYLWSDPLVAAYQRFMACCFATSNGRGTSAKSRANVKRHREAHGNQWNPAWDAAFVPPDHSARRELLKDAYCNLHRQMAMSIGHDISAAGVVAAMLE